MAWLLGALMLEINAGAAALGLDARERGAILERLRDTLFERAQILIRTHPVGVSIN